MPNILWFQLLNSEDLLLFPIVYQSKLNIFGFWTFDCAKQDIGRHPVRFWEVAFLHYVFLMFHRLNF